MRISDWSSDVCSSDLRTHLLDRMPQFAPQDHLGIARPGVQSMVEDQLAVAVQPNQFQLAQLLEEAAEQRLVEEFRRRRRVKQAPPLRQIGRASWRERVCQVM